MASRRQIPSEKTVLESQGGPPYSTRPDSDTSPAVPAYVSMSPHLAQHLVKAAVVGDSAPNVDEDYPSAVIYKLIFFTFAMCGLPIGTFFLTVHTVFKGNSTYAGALAAVMANVVLVGYIVVAMQEDQSDRLEAEAEERRKKAQ